MNFDSIISNIAATVIGGALLALVFFWIREKYFPIPDIMGRWYFELRTTNTSYRPYEEMVLRYTAMLWRDGNRIGGTVEKIYEESKTGERDYVGKNRTRGIAKGYFEKKYFAKDHLFLHVVEDGHGRESTNFHKITINSEQQMAGIFNSMVAKQDGKVTWQRAEF